MKLASFHDGAAIRIGLVEGDEIVDLKSGDDRLPDDLVALIAAGPEGLQAARRAGNSAVRLPLQNVRLAPPIIAPRKFLGLGLSFRSHVMEMMAKGDVIPANQVWFNKQVTSLNGPYDPIHMPRVSSQLDYEGELAIVIGQRARHVRGADAARAIMAGFMVCNDVSVRDWQRRSPTGMLGKSFDTHGPIGPWVTTIDEAPAPEGLGIRTWVDGELRQDGNTSELIYSFQEMIEELTTVFTLEPGDILTTGTPRGVGGGFTPPRFLREGQTVKVAVEGLGYIENLVVPEPA